MSVNRYQPHVFILPEDDANQDIANGFLQEVNVRVVRVLPVAGGWIKAVESFGVDLVPELNRHPVRHLVLLIDFDGDEGRLDQVKARIPQHLRERVFVLGAWTEPEKLKHDLGSYETIGRKLASDCRNDTSATWGHALLRCNEAELARLRQRIRPILFPAQKTAVL